MLNLISDLKALKENSIQFICQDYDYWIFYKQLRTLSLKAFKQRNKETQIKIQPWVSANLHLNNWPQVISFLLLGHVVLAHQVAALGRLMHLAHNTLPLISLWRLSAQHQSSWCCCPYRHGPEHSSWENY